MEAINTTFQSAGTISCQVVWSTYHELGLTARIYVSETEGTKTRKRRYECASAQPR